MLAPAYQAFVRAQAQCKFTTKAALASWLFAGWRQHGGSADIPTAPARPTLVPAPPDRQQPPCQRPDLPGPQHPTSATIYQEMTYLPDSRTADPANCPNGRGLFSVSRIAGRPVGQWWEKPVRPRLANLRFFSATGLLPVDSSTNIQLADENWHGSPPGGTTLRVVSARGPQLRELCHRESPN